MNLCEKAEAFRLLLLMGVIRSSEVIEWADRIILAEEKVPEWLLDVSLAVCDDAFKLASKLRNLPGECNQTVAAYAAMSRFGRDFQIRGRFKSKEAARMLAIWADSANVSDDERNVAWTPGWLVEEMDYVNITDRQVVESIDSCIEHFALIPKQD